jgi:hypothetical protein
VKFTTNPSINKRADHWLVWRRREQCWVDSCAYELDIGEQHSYSMLVLRKSVNDLSGLFSGS